MTTAEKKPVHWDWQLKLFWGLHLWVQISPDVWLNSKKENLPVSVTISQRRLKLWHWVTISLHIIRVNRKFKQLMMRFMWLKTERHTTCHWSKLTERHYNYMCENMSRGGEEEEPQRRKNVHGRKLLKAADKRHTQTPITQCKQTGEVVSVTWAVSDGLRSVSEVRTWLISYRKLWRKT